MHGVYMQDPTFINFVPRTAEQAVDRFTRCRRRGLSAYRIPECVIQCAQKLPPHEMDRFEQWLINPTNVDVINIHPNNEISVYNDAVQKAVYDRVYGDELKAESFPPIPNEVDLADMITESSARCRPDLGDEKLPDVPVPPSSTILPVSTPSPPPEPASAEPRPPPSSPTCAAL